MKLKKNLAMIMAGAMVLSAAPVLPMTSYVNTVYAAKGGAKMAAPKVAPAAPKATTPSTSNSTTAAPNNSKSVSGNGDTYKPSKDAKSLEKNAPATNSKASTASSAANTQSSSRWGNALRNIGLFAGGMMIGSLLSHALGGLFGGMTGMMADILGVIANIVMLAVVFMAIRWLWNKFRGKKNATNVYSSNWQNMNRPQEPINVTPRAEQHNVVQDIQGPSNDYNAKNMADRYRNR